MKLKEIYKLALNRINAKEGDKQIESVVMAGINAGIKLIATQSKKFKTSTITTVLNIPSSMPIDFLSLSMLLTSDGMKLSENDFYIGDDYILVSDSDLVGVLTMIYNYIPLDMDLKLDGDKEPEAKAIFHSVLAAYGAYHYQTLVNNFTAASSLLSEFNSIIGITNPKVKQ
ncbi:MAG TPA: hypothetical protein VIK72_19190 [Clostridiaceae bacterium]